MRLTRPIVVELLKKRGIESIDQDINSIYLPGHFVRMDGKVRRSLNVDRGWSLRWGGGIATNQHLWFLTRMPLEGFENMRALGPVSTKGQLVKLLNETPGLPCPTCWPRTEDDKCLFPSLFIHPTRPHGQIWTWKANASGMDVDPHGYRDCPRCKGEGYTLDRG